MKRLTMADRIEAGRQFHIMRGDLLDGNGRFYDRVTLQDAEPREAQSDPRERWMDRQEDAWRKE
jgi:hypothetical protein